MFLALLLVGGVKVTLHPEATVRGTEISLAQVATVEGDDAAEVVAIVARLRKDAGDFADPRPQPEAL